MSSITSFFGGAPAGISTLGLPCSAAGASSSPQPAAVRARAARPLAIRCLVRMAADSSDPGALHNLLPRQRRSGILETVIAPEELLADRDRRHALDSTRDSLLGRLLEPLLDRAALDALRHGVRVQLTGGRGDQDVVEVGEVAA